MPSFIVALAAALAGPSILAATAAAIGIAVAISQALSTPKPDGLREVVRQATPPRRRGCGRARLGGNYLLDFANATNDLYRVVAFVDGPVSNITRFYLAQDLVTRTGAVVNKTLAGAYGNSQASILDPVLGVHGVTAFENIHELAPNAWPAAAYGTGIFMGATKFYGGSRQTYPTVFPRNKAALNIVGEVNVHFDWRDESQSQSDPSTWKNSANPVVVLVTELFAFRGYDWTTDFLPAIDVLTAQAEICDQAVEVLNVFAQTNVGAVTGSGFVYVEPDSPVPPNGTTLYVGGQSFTVTGAAVTTISGVSTLKISFSGGTLSAGVGVQQQVRWQATPDNPVTEPRYWCGGSWLSSETEADTVKRLLDAMDGFMARRGSDGAVIILAGAFEDDDDPLGADELIDYQVTPYVDHGKAVTELVPYFIPAAWDFVQIDTTPWGDDAAQALYGFSSQPFQPDLVQSNNLVRRLAKIKLSAGLTNVEPFKFKISAIRKLGKRFIRIQAPSETADLADVVLEVAVDPEIVDGGMAVTFGLRKVDPTRYDFDAYTEEGDGPAVTAPGSGPAALDPPTITAADIVTRGVTTGGVSSGDTLRVDVSPPADVATRADLTWRLQWRIVGSPIWNPLGPFTDLGAGDVEVDTPFVPTDQEIELQARYQTGGGRISDWSASFTAGDALTTESGDHITTEAGDIIEPDVAAPAASVETEAGDHIDTEEGDKLDQNP